MKYLKICFCICLLSHLLLNNIYAQTIPVYPDTGISLIHITIDPDSLTQILLPGNEQSDHEYPARFVIHNSFVRDTIENVGFRLRGNTSRYARKKSFKVSFNSFQPGRTYYGYEKLNLNGEHNDPSIIRSKLSWDLFKLLDVPSSDASYIQLYINDAYYGLYINVEHIDENFVQEKFGNSDGNLYKCLWPADLTFISDNPDDYKFGDDTRRTYDLKTNRPEDDYSDLAEFINLLNNTPQTQLATVLDPIFNIDQYLKIVAVDVLTGSWDNYWFLKNNYYLYHNSQTGKFEFIPYDYDNTFGIWWDGIMQGIDWGNRNIYGWGNPAESRPLATKILQNEDFRNRFSYYLHHLLKSGFHPEIINARIDAIHQMISEAAGEDTYRTLDYGFTIDDFHNSFETALGGHVTYGVKPYISTRYHAALNQIILKNVKPFYTEVVHEPRAVQFNDPIQFHVKIRDDSQLDLVKLFYMEEGIWINADMELKESRQTGYLNEFEFAISLPPPESETQFNYYFAAADDSGAVSSAPVGAPRIHYTIPIGYEIPEIYINEFLAGNDSLIADNYGEFEDWIEIYNGGSGDINLHGFYLSDNFNYPDKWAFPDTTIKAGGFILIWADEDQDQGLLHTNFRISRSGEQLGIFNTTATNFAPVDTLSFSEQRSNISMGRLPDGAAEWVFFHTPTPGTTNQIIEDIPSHGQDQPFNFNLGQNYPNPFNPVTNIEFSIPERTDVLLIVYDIHGRRIDTLVDRNLTPGSYHVEWNAGEHASGVYFYYFHTGSYHSVKKMIFLK